MILLMFNDQKKLGEIRLEEINPELKEILSGEGKFLDSPMNCTFVDNSHNAQAGHFPAGSQVFVPVIDLESFKAYPKVDSGCYSTYSFKIIWDENKTKHAEDKHWNIRIYRSIHYKNGSPKIIFYDLPKNNNVDHILQEKSIRLQLKNDEGITLFDRTFYKDESILQ